MQQVVGQARAAREKLSIALSILQSPEAGDLIDTVAGPVARAMGALHRLERTDGAELVEQAPQARDAVRQALSILQDQPASRSADEASAQIASSLGLLHELGLAAQQLAQQRKDYQELLAAREQVAALSRAKKDAERAAFGQQHSQAPVAAAHTSIISEPAPPAPSGGLDATLPKPTRTPFGQEIPLDSTRVSGRTPKRTVPSRQTPADPEPHWEEDSSAAGATSRLAAAPPQSMPHDALVKEASLGAHSESNFYQGLSSHDLVEDGGLFVATYELPQQGQRLWLTVHLPGGYRFQALAQVRWLRGADAGASSPGYGCSFLSVSDEARSLIQRYTKNRTPLFFDEA